jgi:signal transduction histidine kinase
MNLDERQAALDDIESHAQRLYRAVQNLLFFARLERGIRPTLEPILLPQFLKQLIAQRTARLAQNKYQVAIEGELLPVAGDEPLLRILFENLLDNAETFGASELDMEVTCKGSVEQYEVCVTDHGAGVPSDERERIFEPFYRSETVRDRVPGLGLGLAVSSRLATLHGGFLALDSTDAAGTCFAVRLPTVRS